MSSNIILNQNLDPGRDGASTTLSGQPNNPNEVFAKDVMAFALHYYDQFDYEDENGNPVSTNDYTPIAAGGLTPLITVLPAANITNSDVAANTNDLFNGNIKAMQTTLTNPTSYAAMPMANAYQYDQLNRLLSSNSFINLTGNQWGNAGTYDNRYLNTFEYDAMGNIIHQNRYTEAGVQIEDMSYGYKRDTDGHLLRNRLYHINEPINLTSLDDTDIDDMGGTFNPQDIDIETNWNYSYDEEGRLIKDVQEGIDEIVWRVDGKVKEIHRPQNSDKKNISFDYDAMGNRIAKHVFDDNWNLEKSTYYILDAQGNQMSVYEHEVANSNVTYTLKERHIYGSSSLGILMDSILMGSSTSGNTINELGLKTYSMSNHLGNVLTVISDIKIPQASGGLTTTGYWVGIRNISDYSPFGVLLKERTVESAFYRRGFQGQEHDDEVKGKGNSYDFRARMLDPRIGRWLKRDPLETNYPNLSTYSFVADNPLVSIDPDGERIIWVVKGKNKRLLKSQIRRYKKDDAFNYVWNKLREDRSLIVEIDVHESAGSALGTSGWYYGLSVPGQKKLGPPNIYTDESGELQFEPTFLDEWEVEPRYADVESRRVTINYDPDIFNTENSANRDMSNAIMEEIVHAFQYQKLFPDMKAVNDPANTRDKIQYDRIFNIETEAKWIVAYMMKGLGMKFDGLEAYTWFAMEGLNETLDKGITKINFCHEDYWNTINVMVENGYGLFPGTLSHGEQDQHYMSEDPEALNEVIENNPSQTKSKPKF